MSAYTFGFIGAGNMGSALARAACRTLPAGEIILSNRTAAKSKALAGELGCTAGDNRTVAAEAAYIFLGVKPHMMAGLLSEIAPVLAERRDSFVLVTMAAGLTMERIAAMAGGDYPVIRIMPNTPCAVGAGVVLYDANERISEAALEKFTAGMAGAGFLDRLEERLIDAGSAVAGCGPYACFWRDWPTAGWPAAFPGRRPCGTPPRWRRAPPSSCWRRTSTPAP